MIRGEKFHLRLAREDDLSALADLLNDVHAAGEFWPITLVPEPTLRKRYHEDGLCGDDFGQFASERCNRLHTEPVRVGERIAQ